MGGTVAVTVVEPDGTEHRMARWTNSMSWFEVSTELLSKIENEIYENYIIKEWDKFNYISIEPPLWSYIVLVVVMAISQTIFWLWAHYNEQDKKDES